MSSSYAFLYTHSSAADGGIEAEAEGEGDTEEDGEGDTDDDGLGDTEDDGDGDTQATTTFFEHTLAGSTTNIGAVTGEAIATAVGLGEGAVVTTGVGLRTKYTILTVAMIAKNMPSEMSRVFFVVGLIVLLLSM